MAIQTYQHWRIEVDHQQILWLYFNRHDRLINSLNAEAFAELDIVLDHIFETNPLAVIIASAKQKGFIAGADISQFSQLEDTEQAFDVVRKAQHVFDKLAALPIPTVAMISGFCLGGGCELVLACRYRVAEDIPVTRIGLPEVKLGIHPGWGGTVRLPALIGVIPAMKIILAGSSVSAKQAAKIGLVDAAVAGRELKRAACYFALQKPQPKQPSRWMSYANNPLFRPLLAKLLLNRLSKKANESHYPAPFATVRNWAKEGVSRSAYVREAKSIATLLTSPTSRELVRVFFLQDRLKSLAKKIDQPLKHIHVIGAGTMGGDIAAWCAYKGFSVTLQDSSTTHIAMALKRAHGLYRKKQRQPHLVQAIMDRLQPDVHGLGIKKADLVIEAIFENLEAKQALYQTLEPQLKSGAFLATNTSSIPLDELSTSLRDPARLVGIHFFNPVAKMPLVEVIASQKTAAVVVEQAMSFVTRLSRLPIMVKATPGFLVNRLLLPYLLEAAELVEEGIPLETVDKIAMDFGMPMGPITLLDTVGLDVCLSVAEILMHHYGGKVSESLSQLVKQGYYGKKTGRGFYVYRNNKALPSDTAKRSYAIPEKDVQDRLIFRMLNEAVTCLQEQTVTDADLLDAGMIFGTGFAPFRGGPIQYAKQQGIEKVLARFTELQHQYGERFKSSKGWEFI